MHSFHLIILSMYNLLVCFYSHYINPQPCKVTPLQCMLSNHNKYKKMYMNYLNLEESSIY